MWVIVVSGYEPGEVESAIGPFDSKSAAEDHLVGLIREHHIYWGGYVLNLNTPEPLPPYVAPPTKQEEMNAAYADHLKRAE